MNSWPGPKNGTASWGLNKPWDTAKENNRVHLLKRKRLSPCDLLGRCATLSGCMGSSTRGQVNFLLDCLEKAKNIVYAPLIVIPCEIKERREHD